MRNLGLKPHVFGIDFRFLWPPPVLARHSPFEVSATGCKRGAACSKLLAMSRSKPRRAAREVKALLFDFGGTLAFLDFELLADEFSRPGRRLDPVALERAEYVGRRALDDLMAANPGHNLDGAYRVFFEAWVGAAGFQGEEGAECLARFRAIHKQASLWRVVRSGTFEALDKLRAAGLKLAIVSNAEGQVEGDARRFGLAPYFDAIIDSQVVGVAKPDPRIFRIAMERLGVGPEQTRFAGDIYSIDMVGAKAAGIEGSLIDRMELYHWVDHHKIRGIQELHPTD